MAILEIKNLGLSLADGKRLLDNVSLSLEKGQILGIGRRIRLRKIFDRVVRVRDCCRRKNLCMTSSLTFCLKVKICWKQKKCSRSEGIKSR